MVKVLLYFILSQFHLPSIHQIEYYANLDKAVFSPVSDTPVAVVPLLEEKGLRHIYYGYCPYWIDTSEYAYIDFSLITHVAYFSVTIDTTGSLGGIPYSYRFLTLIDKAHKRGIRVHITFTIFGNTSVSTFLNNPTARLNAINNIIQFVENYNIEGVNIDFEFVTLAVKDSFSRFINDLYYALQNNTSRRKDLFIAMPAVPEWYPGYDYTYLSTHSDGLFIMGYDFHYRNSQYAGPVAPAIPSSLWGQYCIAKTIGSYKARCSPSKLILGMPYYGYRWPTESGNINSPTTGAGSSVLAYTAMQEATTYGRLWDTYSLTPWYRYISDSQWYQVWYDDTASIRIKIQMAIDSSLRGVGCWALTYDDGVFNSIIREKLEIPLPREHFVVRVITTELNIREGPSTTYPVITTAPYGSKFVAFHYEGNWYKIYFPSASGSYYGYMSAGDGINSRYLEGSSGDTIALCTADLLNVRVGPSTSYSVITQITKGQSFVVDSIVSGWARIYLPNIQGNTKGWISLNYVNLFYNLENYNPLSGQLLEITYPDSTYMPYDTFTLCLKIKNTSYSSFDSLTCLVSTQNPSHFYYPEYWIEPNKARSIGHFGLPGQTFYFNFKMRVSAKKNQISETFYLLRNNDTILGPITISVTLPVTERIQTPLLSVNGKYITINGIGPGIAHLEIFDIMGRRIASREVRDGEEVELDLPHGVYFVVLKKNNKILVNKKLARVY